MALFMPVGLARIRFQCVMNASRSEGSRGMNAAMRFASVSFCCSKRMGRSLSARSRRIMGSGKVFLQNDASKTGDATRFYNEGAPTGQPDFSSRRFGLGEDILDTSVVKAKQTISSTEKLSAEPGRIAELMVSYC